MALVLVATLSSAVFAQSFTEFPFPAGVGTPIPSSNGEIGRITTAGVVTGFPAPTRFSFPYSIAAGSDGALWITDNVGNFTGGLSVQIDRITGAPSWMRRN
ncbi:MAG: hypothetical protein ACM3SU_13850 [Acidobacteriota bacterium]